MLAAALGAVLGATPHWPEELWLQAYVANHDVGYASSVAHGPLSVVGVGQLCWRGKSHFVNGSAAAEGLRSVVDGIRDGSLRDARQWYASKVPRGLHEPAARYMLALDAGVT